MDIKQKTNVILIGMPGTGKSTVGVVLAKKMCFSFIDTDLLLATKHERPLYQIIREQGFDGFIKLEGGIGEALQADKTVVATGGSMIFSDSAMVHLKRIGTVVYLDTDISVLERRINRNMFERGVATARPMTVHEIYEYRKPLYEKYADITIKCKDSLEMNVDMIADALRN